MTANRAQRWIGWAVVGAAVLLQWGWALRSRTQPVSDFRRYFEVAAEFAATGHLSHGARPYIYQPPAYPFVLGCLFKITGPSVTAGKLLNAGFGSAAVILLWLTLRRTTHGGWLGLIAFAVTALYPLWLAYVSVLGTECLSAFLVTACVAALAWRPGRWGAVLSGACMGLLILSRPQFLLVAPVMLAWSVWRANFGRWPAWTIAAAVTVLPWTLRNFAVSGDFVPVCANAGYVLLVNNNSGNELGGWMPLSSVPLTSEDGATFARLGARGLFAPGDEDAKTFAWTPAIDRAAMSAAGRWIIAHPARFAALAGKRVWRCYGRTADLTQWISGAAPWPAAVVAYCDVVGWAAFVAALAGMVTALRPGRHPALAVAAAMYGVGLLSVLVFEGQGRYALVTWPLAAVLVCGITGGAAATSSGAPPS